MQLLKRVSVSGAVPLHLKPNNHFNLLLINGNVPLWFLKINQCFSARLQTIKTVIISGLLLLFFSTTVFAMQPDSTDGSFALSAHIHYGFIIPHRPSVIGLVTGHTVGLELDLIKPAVGKKSYQRIYGYPEVGLSYCYFNLGNDKVIGRAQALYPFVDFPLAKGKNLKFNLRVGWGIGYVQKPFDSQTNFKNNLLGSYINGLMSVRGELQYRIAPRNKLAFAWGITHLSNGSFATPNLGINVTTMSLAYQYYFGEPKKINHDSLPAFKKKWVTSFYAAAFKKEIYPADGDKYLTSTFYGNYGKRLSRKSTLGFGADVFYSAAIIESMKREGKPYTDADAWRVGLHASYILSLDDLSIVMEEGVYVYAQLESDTFLYTRLGLRQKITKHVFACFNLKTHFAKADFFELGIGYEL